MPVGPASDRGVRVHRRALLNFLPFLSTSACAAALESQLSSVFCKGLVKFGTGHTHCETKRPLLATPPSAAAPHEYHPFEVNQSKSVNSKLRVWPVTERPARRCRERRSTARFSAVRTSSSGSKKAAPGEQENAPGCIAPKRADHVAKVASSSYARRCVERA